MTPEETSLPRACALYFIAAMAFQALMMAFFPLYCHYLGFTDAEIAIVSSGENLATILGPPLLAAIPLGMLGRYGRMALYSVLPFFFFLPILVAKGLWPITILWFLALAFNRTSLSLVNERALGGQMNFGRVRLWGSLSFMAAMYVAGQIIDWLGRSYIPWLMVGVLASVIWVSLRYPVLEERREATGGGAFRALRSFDRESFFFLSAVVLLWASHGPLYTYFSLHGDRLGWSTVSISIAWIIAVGSEVAMFYWYDAVERRTDNYTIFRISIILSIIRWIAMALTTSLPAIFVIQILHAFSFGSAYIATMRLVPRVFPEEIRPIGQAILMAFGTGLGSLTGKVLAGVGANLFVTDNFCPLFWGAAALSALSFTLTRYARK